MGWRADAARSDRSSPARQPTTPRTATSPPGPPKTPTVHNARAKPAGVLSDIGETEILSQQRFGEDRTDQREQQKADNPGRNSGAVQQTMLTLPAHETGNGRIAGGNERQQADKVGRRSSRSALGLRWRLRDVTQPPRQCAVAVHASGGCATEAGNRDSYLLAQRVNTLSPRRRPLSSSRPSTNTAIPSARLSGRGPGQTTFSFAPSLPGRTTARDRSRSEDKCAGGDPAAHAQAAPRQRRAFGKTLVGGQIVLPTGRRAAVGHDRSSHWPQSRRQSPSSCRLSSR